MTRHERVARDAAALDQVARGVPIGRVAEKAGLTEGQLRRRLGDQLRRVRMARGEWRKPTVATA